ncbi:hypothetical protein AFLA_011203 [Aspergillus flavus NRRL3357]|nr:hypothetical protein AFLA_011203 [Aspergillus flavus NRRL3357]
MAEHPSKLITGSSKFASSGCLGRLYREAKHYMSSRQSHEGKLYQGGKCCWLISIKERYSPTTKGVEVMLSAINLLGHSKPGKNSRTPMLVWFHAKAHVQFYTRRDLVSTDSSTSRTRTGSGEWLQTDGSMADRGDAASSPRRNDISQEDELDWTSPMVIMTPKPDCIINLASAIVVRQLRYIRDHSIILLALTIPTNSRQEPQETIQLPLQNSLKSDR